jgi:hypothetical protein
MEIQRDACEKFGHRHVVVTDTDLPGFDTFKTEFPESLMKAILWGQYAFIDHWDGKTHLALFDVDVLPARDLTEAFDWPADLGVTPRANTKCPINNGAMYVAAGHKKFALKFFEKALEACEDHWGGDQEAVSKIANAPPHEVKYIKIAERLGGRVALLPMVLYNCIPEIEGLRHKKRPFVVHFKGETRKPWMKIYFNKWVK